MIQCIRRAVRRFPLGYACFRPIINPTGEVQDYVVIEMNDPFRRIVHGEMFFSPGRSVQTAFPNTGKSQLQVLKSLADDVILGRARNLETPVYLQNRHFKMMMFRPMNQMLSVLLIDPDDVSGDVMSCVHRPPLRLCDATGLESLCDPDMARTSEQACKLLREAPRDSLTGLLDRCFAVEFLERMDAAAIWPFSVILGDVDGLKLTNDALGYEAGDLLLKEIARVFQENCRKNDVIARWSGDEFIMVLPRTPIHEAQRVTERLRRTFSEKRERDQRISISLGYITRTDASCDLDHFLQEAEKWMLRKKLLSRSSHRNDVINLLLSTLYERSAETEEHSGRMAEHCRMIAQTFGLNEEEINDLVLLAMLHDIGKVGVNQQILNKPGSLTREERLEVQRHPEIGFRIARNIPELTQIAEYILRHHEWWNGNGYPLGLKGEEIPLPCRIISVVDAYDVMITGRVYRAARTRDEVIRELMRCAGSQFDPAVVRVFVRILLEERDRDP